MQLPIGPYPFGGLERPIAIAFALVVITMRVCAHYMAMPWMLALLAGLVPFLLLYVPGRAHFGEDGVLLRWLGLRRFIDAGRIKSASLNGRSIAELVLADGSILTISGPNASRIVEEVLSLKSRHAARITAEHDLLMKHGGTRERIAGLRLLGIQSTSIRTSALCSDRLWEVFESPSAHPSARAAAVVALKPTLGTGGQQRVRVALEAIASPKLRVAIERCASSDDDEEIARVLESIRD